MELKTRYRLIWLLFALVLSGVALMPFGLQAQDSTTCQPFVEALWTLASEACVGKPEGYICNGGSAPQAQPAGAVGYALASVGALVEVAAVDSLRSPAISPEANVGGVVWARILPPVQVTMLMIGDVFVQDVTPPDFATWQSIIVQTGSESPTCADLPQHSVLVQVVNPNATMRVVINGISIDITGTMLVRTTTDSTMLVSLSGGLRVLAYSAARTVWAGQQVSVPFTPGNFAAPSAPPGEPTNFDPLTLGNIPVELLDRPVPIPQPGYVTTAGLVNLRSAPSTQAILLAEVPAGQVLSVLGYNSDGDWYHVQMSGGLTGWMFAELLIPNVGAISHAYDATPVPPGRYGTPTLTATVIAPDGVFLRDAPDVSFAVIGSIPYGATVYLVARSPYSPWVRVQTTEAVFGWLALITLETTAYIESLPIEYDVPPPPPPTAIPGSFGNAFPDPDNDGG